MERRKHNALCWTAPQTLNTGDSVLNMAAVRANAGLQAAATRWSAGSRPAERTVGLVTAHSKIAGRLHGKQGVTARSIQRSRYRIDCAFYHNNIKGKQ